MKPIKIMLVAMLTSLLAVVACASPDENLPTPSPTAPVDLPATEAYPPAPDTGDDGYPAPATRSTIDEGYPVPSSPVAAPDMAYPADMTFWISRPWGEQCVDPESYAYADLEEALAALEEAGVNVLEAEETTRAVCSACDCPTSEHFRALIRADDLAIAQDIGWFRE